MKPNAHMDSKFHCSSVQWSLSGRLKLWLQSESPDFPLCHFTTSKLIESFRSGCQLLDFSQFWFQLVYWWIRKLKIIQYFQNIFSYFYYGKEIWFYVFKWNIPLEYIHNYFCLCIPNGWTKSSNIEDYSFPFRNCWK